MHMPSTIWRLVRVSGPENVGATVLYADPHLQLPLCWTVGLTIAVCTLGFTKHPQVLD